MVGCGDSTDGGFDSSVSLRGTVCGRCCVGIEGVQDLWNCDAREDDASSGESACLCGILSAVNLAASLECAEEVYEEAA